MARSAWRCRDADCGAVLGWVHGGSKAFRPAPQTVVVWHGVSATAICPYCGAARVFAGWTLVLKRL